MRALILCALFAVAPVAAAAQTPPAAEVSPARYAAAIELAEELLVHSGGLRLAVEEAAASLMPEFRNNIRQSPPYVNGTRERRRALDTFMDNLPTMIREEAVAATPTMIEYMAQGFAQMFDETTSRAVATHLRQPPVREEFLAGVRGGARNEPPAPTSPEAAALNAAFSETPEGQAFMQHEQRVYDLLGEAMRVGFAAPMQRRVFREFCAALGDECPPALQQAT